MKQICIILSLSLLGLSFAAQSVKPLLSVQTIVLSSPEEENPEEKMADNSLEDKDFFGSKILTSQIIERNYQRYYLATGNLPPLQPVLENLAPPPNRL